MAQLNSQAQRTGRTRTAAGALLAARETNVLREWRQALHAHPELAFREAWTSEFIASRLESFGLRPERGLGVTGVVASLRAGTSPRSIALRADMDGLALEERSQVSYRSMNPGCMHACGHDGHVAMLLGAAERLARRPDFDGTVHFVFQPAEENEAGAKRMLDEGLFDRFPCDSIFALHNMPGLDVGKFSTRVGALLASADFFYLTVHGRAGHAASPQKALDPIPIAAELVTLLNAIVSRHVNPFDAAVLTVTSIHAGTTTNVIGASAELSGTVRSLDSAVRGDIELRVRRLARALGEAHGARIDIRYESRYIPTVNATGPTQLALQAARTVVGATAVADDAPAVMGAEDFGWFAQAVPANFTWIGAGASSPELHTPEFDFDDALLPLGVDYWVELVRAALGSNGSRVRANRGGLDE